MSDRRRAVVRAGVGAYLATGVLMTRFWNESDAEMLGLGFFALAVALIARPPVKDGDSARAARRARGRRQLVLLAVPRPDRLAAVAGIAVYRKRVRRSWGAYAAVAVVGRPGRAAAAVLPKLVGTLNVGSHLLLAGPIVRMQRRFLAGLAIVAFLGLVRAGTRRSPAYRVMFGQLLAGAAALAVFWAYQVLSVGGTVYYFEKMLHAWTVLCLVALGPAVLLAAEGRPRPSRRRLRDPSRPCSGPGTRSARSRPVVAAAVLAGGLHWGRDAIRRTPRTRHELGRGVGVRPHPEPLRGQPQSPLQREVPRRRRAHHGAAVRPALGQRRRVQHPGRAQPRLRPPPEDAVRPRRTSTASPPASPCGPRRAGKALPYGDRSEVKPNAAWPGCAVSSAASPIPLRVVVWDPWVERELRKFAAERPDLGLRIVRVDRLGRPV
ncbi:hypothetical protein ACU686_23815 [Yinghuangia aomiensis]